MDKHEYIKFRETKAGGIKMDLAFLIIAYFLSIFHFAYGYKEAIRISEENGKVNGWSVIFSFPLGFIFAFFTNFFYHKIYL
jgi:hypothetical protein